MNLERVKSMEVEIEGEDGSKLAIGPQKSVFGRASGFHTKDRTVSRRHVCFQLSESEDGDGRVSFEVIGRNPIWVCSHRDQSLMLFRKFEKGHLEFGDRFCLSAKTPVWFHLNSNQVAVAELLNKGESDIESSSSRADLDIDHIDLSKIDPVKEFGFLVIGHEFDQYPKGKIRDVKDWEWFLDEPSKDSDDDDDENKGKERRKMKRKRKKGKDNGEDEEWRGESEDDKDIAARIRKGKRPEYSTRSKDSGKGHNRGTKGSSSSRTSSKQKKTTAEEEEDEDDDDETLGGFIVDDEEDDKEENDEEEEEEEFEEDEDEENED